MKNKVIRTPQEQEKIDFRYEKKYVVERMDLAKINAIIKLHSAAFVTAYPARWVNNIYFDSMDLTNYREHIGGIDNRNKFRIRWYGDLEGVVEKPVLEIKSKKGYVGCKFNYPLESFVFGPDFSRERLIGAILQSPAVPEKLKHTFGAANLTLVNRYHRDYYKALYDGTIRLTVDTQMIFYELSGGGRKNYLNEYSEDRLAIIELKYSAENAPKNVRRLQGLPFRMGQFSKYCYGIERVSTRFS